MPRTGKVIMSDVEGSGNCLGLAAMDKSGRMVPWKFTRRDCGPKDVAIQIVYTGVCHSDLHMIRSDWGPSNYPIVPGHEFLGEVVKVGGEVTKFKKGDYAAIGCLVNSCGECERCKLGEEQYCMNGMIMTYNSTDRDGTITYGGYSSYVVVTEKFVLKLPPKLFKPSAAPLLCAGITVYSPMQFYGITEAGMRVGVVGLGGLGSMACKFLKSFGAHVTVLSRSDKKKEDAMKSLGVDDFLATSDESQLEPHKEGFDAIIDTVSAHHDVAQILSLLKVDGKLVMLGVPNAPYTIHASSFVMRRKTIGGSLIGGLAETQRMLDYCAEKDITCEVETIKADYINEALDRLDKGDVKYRFVIEVKDSMIPDEADLLQAEA